MIKLSINFFNLDVEQFCLDLLGLLVIITYVCTCTCVHV